MYRLQTNTYNNITKKFNTLVTVLCITLFSVTMAESLEHQVDKMEISSSDKKEEQPSVCVAGLSGLLSQDVPCPKKSPVCLIVLGMAGSGKTSLVQRLTSDLNTLNKPPYVINLDPACLDVPYPANIGKSFIDGKQIVFHLHYTVRNCNYMYIFSVLMYGFYFCFRY